MKQIRDAIVIGSGIIGSATALALNRAGVRRVTLIEKGPLTSGMTRRNAGLVHPFQPHPLLCDLAIASYETYNQWALHLTGKSSFVETGATVVANSGNENLFAMWTQHSGNANIISPDALNALYPELTGLFGAAMFTSQAGYADAVLTAQAMVKTAQDHGLEIQTGTQVKQIIVQQRHIQGVKTTTGELEAPAVIVAAGGWTEKLLAPIGVTLRLKYKRGTILFYEQPSTLTGDLPMVLDANSAFFFRPHPYHMSAAGRVAVETQPYGLDAIEEYVTPSEAASVKQFVDGVVPALINVTPKRSHAIVYDTLGDGLPAMGKVVNLDGLYVAAGFGASAFAVAPAVGATLAEILIDGSSARDISSFDPLRASAKN